MWPFLFQDELISPVKLHRSSRGYVDGLCLTFKRVWRASRRDAPLAEHLGKGFAKMLGKGFAKKFFGGKKEDVGYTPPPLPSQATWLSDTAGSPASPAPSSEAAGGGSKLGLGASRKSWAAGAGDAQLDESRREQEQHLWEQQQLEEALRISREMARQSEETRSAAAATATSAITGVQYEAEKRVPAVHGLFAGLSVGSAPNAATAERGGPSEAGPRSSTRRPPGNSPRTTAGEG